MALFLNDKLSDLDNIYTSFAQNTKEFKKLTVCQKGCAFCCSKAGSIDITTLEGWQIKKQLKNLPKTRQKTLNKILGRDIRKRETKKLNPCPFLMKSNACMIYDVRPFSCRRIYSTHVCEKNNPPQVNRQAMVMANKTLKELQALDDTGYSGHISFILHMLNSPAFLETYKNGKYNPHEIMVFGKSHGIIINKMMI